MKKFLMGLGSVGSLAEISKRGNSAMKSSFFSPGAVTAPKLLLSVLALAVVPVTGAVNPDTTETDPPESAQDRRVTMNRYEVKASVLGSIGVNFSMNKPEADDPTATIFWATVTEVTPGSTGGKSGLSLQRRTYPTQRPADPRAHRLAEFFGIGERGNWLHGNLTWKVSPRHPRLELHDCFQRQAGVESRLIESAANLPPSAPDLGPSAIGKPVGQLTQLGKRL